jgi:FkbM family methyltransferase
VIVQGESGMRFAVRTDDREIGRHTFVHGSYDLETMRCAMRLLEAEGDGRPPLSGRTVLDVGANIGTSIVPMLTLFGADRGLAVEPAPDNVEMLRLNLALNELTERVRVFPMALSDHDGTLELELSAENFGDHRLRVPGTEPTAETASRPTVTVPVRRLDALVESGEIDASSLGLIWLDVQGHEGHVLSGGRNLLDARIPVLTEFWPSTMGRTGGLDLFRDLVRSCFARIVDVRVVEAEGHAEALPSSRIDELAERYADPATFTDLLLLP